MTTYIKNTEDRKDIINRIAVITGQKLKYTMPHYRYIGQGFTVTREGDLVADETADMSVVETLIAEGLILAAENQVEPAEGSPTDGTERPTEGATEEQAEQGERAEETPTESLVDAPEDEDAEVVEDGAESLVGGAEPDGETERAEAATGSEDALTISFPLTNHTATSIRNLVAMIYSRGNLLSKATGGRFHTTNEQVEDLTDCISVNDVREHLSTDDLEGMIVEADKITFTGFPATTDSDKIHSFTQLTARMNRMALKQKRTMAKKIDETNERYIFRIWLTALGMKGDEYKTARRILLSPLSGNSAFKDQAMENRWKEKQAAKRR